MLIGFSCTDRHYAVFQRQHPLAPRGSPLKKLLIYVIKNQVFKKSQTLAESKVCGFPRRPIYIRIIDFWPFGMFDLSLSFLKIPLMFYYVHEYIWRKRGRLRNNDTFFLVSDWCILRISQAYESLNILNKKQKTRNKKFTVSRQMFFCSNQCRDFVYFCLILLKHFK